MHISNYYIIIINNIIEGRMKKDIVVIGVGRFGSVVIKELYKTGKKILAIDKDENALNKIEKNANQIRILDATDPEALKLVGVDKVEKVIVGASDNVEVVAALTEIGVKTIIAKATSEGHARILKQIGVNIIVRPQIEAALKIALLVNNDYVLKNAKNIYEINDGYVLSEIILKNIKLDYKTIKNTNFRNWRVNVIAIKRGKEFILPDGETILKLDDAILMIGKLEDIAIASQKIGTQDNKNQNLIWKRYFKNKEKGMDAYGREINKNNFVVDHIWPKSKGGKDNIENLIPISQLSNEEKSNNTSGIVNGKNFIVEETQTNSCIGTLFVEKEKMSK